MLGLLYGPSLAGLGAVAPDNPYDPVGNPLAYQSYNATYQNWLQNPQRDTRLYPTPVSNVNTGYKVTPTGLIAPASYPFSSADDLDNALAIHAAEQTSAGIQNQVRAGIVSPTDLVNDIPLYVQDFCRVNPYAAGCGNPASLINKYQQEVASYYTAFIPAAATQPGYGVSPAAPPAQTQPKVVQGPTTVSVIHNDPNLGTKMVLTSVKITNLDGSNSTFYIGDTWHIEITGAPNQPVTDTAQKDGVNLGTTPYGSTDANGYFSLQGQMGSGEVGKWIEQWSVSGMDGNAISFTVLNQSRQPATTTPTTTTTTPSSTTPVDFTNPQNLGTQNVLQSAENWLSSLTPTQMLTYGGVAIVGLIGLSLAFSGSGRRR